MSIKTFYGREYTATFEISDEALELPKETLKELIDRELRQAGKALLKQVIRDCRRLR